MSGVNKVILIGNLGSDPEIRHLESGTAVANFNIATTERYTDRQGNKQEQTEWHRIELWDGLARIAEQYLKKGSKVYVEGKLRTDQWTDQNGQNRYTTKIRGINMTMLDGRSDSPAGGGGYQQSAPQASAPQSSAPASAPAANFEVPEEESDDLPF